MLTRRTATLIARDSSRSTLPVALIGLCVFTYAIVTYRWPVGDVGIAISLIGLLFQRGTVQTTRLFWLYFAFVLWALLASFASDYAGAARAEVVERLKLALVILVASSALQTARQLRFYLLFYLACFSLYPLRGALFNYFLYGERLAGRAIWNYIYANPNDLAALSLLTLGIALSVATSRAVRSLFRWAAGASAALCVAVIFLTESRGVFIGLAACMVPAAIGLVWRNPKRLIYGAILVSIAAYTIPQPVWTRLSGIEKLTNVEADPEGSAAQRFEILKVATRIALDHPIFGVGLGAYRKTNARYAPELGQRDAHNTYVSLAAELGIPGLALWVALFAIGLRSPAGPHNLGEHEETGIEEAWIARSLVGFLIAGAFGTYSALTFPYLVLVILTRARLLRSGTRRLSTVESV
jgi:putative inorganic carbon (HCO3(-)) transporter